MIRVDFPEPETPVTQVNRPTGIDRSTFFKLLPTAPLSSTVFFASFGVRCSGTAIFFTPLRY
ncbi:Uncharacterised protein [Vibrio cholerae]|nr:Uncharacterised protein [Vibrio cholerae]